MGSQISPGILSREIDLTTVVPAVSTTQAGYVGQFGWGPLSTITLVKSEDELAQGFGKPTSTTAISFFTAASFLAYGSGLNLVRVADETNAKNATCEATTGSGTAGTGLLIKNDSHYDANYAGGAGNVGQWAARHPGILGNSLKVSMCPSADAYGKTLTGTVTSSGTAVTGSGTAFATELVVGSFLVSNGIERKVTAIASATALTLEAAFPTDLSAATVKSKWEFADQFRVAPGTSEFAAARSGVNDEMHIIVVDGGGVITGQKDAVLEKFGFVSKASDAKLNNGQTNYYANVVNRTSQWIRWMDHVPAGSNFGTTATGTTFTAVAIPSTFRMAGGADGNAITDANRQTGYDLFKNEDAADISLVFMGDSSASVCSYVITNLAEVRKDLVVFVSPAFADVVANTGNEASACITFRNSLPSSSYAFMDCNWKLVLDKYNDVTRWVPCNGDMAGLCAYTDEIRDPWFAPAGVNRGILRNIIKLAWNPVARATQDQLYSVGINPVIMINGTGNVLWGDKTLLSRPSAFDRINVRRLFITLRKTISLAARSLLFEQNDEFTRAQFKNIVEPFLRDVQGRRGLFDFKVVCDSSNNPGSVVDRNEFVGDIYLKPTRVADYITLNFVAVGTSVDFNTVVGQF